MNRKMPIIAALAAVAVCASATAVYALDSPGVAVVKVDMTKVVGIMTSESGAVHAMVVGPGSAATYDITNPSNPVPVHDTVEGVTELYWSHQHGVALASIGGESYAVVAMPTGAAGGSVAVVHADAPMAGHVEQPAQEPPVSISALDAYVSGDRLVIRGSISSTEDSGTKPVSISSVSTDFMSFDMDNMKMLAGGHDGVMRTYAITTTNATGVYDLLADDGIAGSLEFLYGWEQGTRLGLDSTTHFGMVLTGSGEPYGVDVRTVAQFGGTLTLTITADTDSDVWNGDERSTRVLFR